MTIPPKGGEPFSGLDPLIDLISDLHREATRDDLPHNLRTLTRKGLEQTKDLLEAASAGNHILVDEIVLGTLRKDGKRNSDGLRQILPLWARGTELLTSLAGLVDVDESQDPVTVSIHHERVPRSLRPAAASLASELVDAYQPRPKGGRPRKASRIISAAKPGYPDTGALTD